MPEPTARPQPVHPAHGGDGARRWTARAMVVEIAFSPDGSKLAVVYYTPPMNRPGTDWAVWTVLFDLNTGHRTVLAETCGPLAFSRDGQWLAVTGIERQRHEWQANWQLRLHRTGAETPPLILSAGSPADQTPAAMAFGPRGDYLKVLHSDGMLRHWPVNIEQGEQEHRPTQPIDLIRLGADLEADLRPQPTNWFPRHGSMSRNPQGRWTVFLGQTRWEDARRELDRRTGPVAMSWHYVERDRHVYRVSTLAELPGVDPAKAFTANWRSQLVGAAGSQTLVLRTSDVEGHWPQRPIQAGHQGLVSVAYAPRGRLAAISTSGGVELRGSGPMPALTFLPGSRGGAMAFSPDERLLAVGDRNAVIRLWDVQAGRIVRSLRLDDQPAETIPVAAVQAASVFGDPAANRATLARQVQGAALLGAWVVVLPEAAVTGYLSPDLKQTWQVDNRATSEGLTGRDPNEAAETVPGPSTEFFSRVARENGVYLTVPLVEVDRRTGDYYNTVVLLGPDGRTLLHYRKRDPWPWAERSWATAGNLGNPVVDTPLGRLGVLICYDIHQQAAIMARQKVDTLLYSIAWVEDAESEWFERRLPAIAAEHGFHIVAANWTIDPKAEAPAWHGHGQSRIIHADGRVLAARDRKVESAVVFAELPLPAQAK